MPIYLFSKEPCNQNDNTVMYFMPYSNNAIAYKCPSVELTLDKRVCFSLPLITNLYLPGE